ncbi:AB hydrolase superfamily protein [Abortiporus biennis]
MARLPFLGRLRRREYSAIFLGAVFVTFETLLSFIIAFLPKAVIEWFYDRSRSLFDGIFGHPSLQECDAEEVHLADRIRRAQDFEKLCDIFGYSFEEHVVLTKDGYLLGLHRICNRRGETVNSAGRSTGKPVVYLHHGLLMNSEVWVCLTEAQRSIPFVLVELGYDVWMGNNRGNKYSKKSIFHDPNSSKFWDYSIDNFAWNDIPDSIEYILDLTGEESVSYIGFSQGSAQAFAALSIHPQLNQRVNVFIALAPAMRPAGLAAPIVDGLMKASPTLLFLLFGRKIILSSAATWQAILYPPIFCSIINSSMRWLFNWHSFNIPETQKLAAYSHLYSFASTKSVVHWFQIMRNGRFVMYDDDVQKLKVGGGLRSTGVTSYAPARFPTRNITSPIVLLYGDCDSLVDISQMLHELPRHTVATRLRGYEHLDILWGGNVHRDVIPHVIDALKKHCVNPERVKTDVGLMVNGSGAVETSGQSTPNSVYW